MHKDRDTPMERRRSFLRLLAPLGAVMLQACASAPTPAAPDAMVSDPCPVGVQVDGTASVSPASDRPIVLALPGPIDVSHAPVPRTPAERLLFAQLYETLVRVNCEGRVEGVLAESWDDSDGGLEWTFTLREDALDWNQDRVSPRHVSDSWAAASALAPIDPVADRAATILPPPRISAVAELDARRVSVRLSEPVDAAWFARPELVVRTGASVSGWPIGTGAFRPTLDMPAVPARPLTAVALNGPFPLEARAVTGDPRTALEGGADLLVTDAPEVIDYAETAPAFTTVPLDWDRTYLLLVPAAASETFVLQPPEAEHRTLQDALPNESRRSAAAGALEVCAARGARTPETATSLSQTRARRVVYQSGDPVARAIAERLIALALDPGRAQSTLFTTMVPDLAGSGSRPSAGALAVGAFTEALQAGRDAAYVVAVDGTRAADGCGELAHVMALAPWLLATATAPAVRPAIVPLLDTHSTLVLRRGVVGVAVDGSGVLRLSRLRRMPPGSQP